MIGLQLLQTGFGGNEYSILSLLSDSTSFAGYNTVFPTITDSPEDYEELQEFYKTFHPQLKLGYSYLLEYVPNLEEYLGSDKDKLIESATIGCLYEVPNAERILNRLGTTLEEIISSPKGEQILKGLHIDLQRFIKSQDLDVDGYDQAYKEILEGKKKEHWIWYIFPQLEAITHNLHRSWETGYFGITGRPEAIAYINNTKLKTRYLELCNLLYKSNKSIPAIFGNDWMKVRSSLLLFNSVAKHKEIQQVLVKAFWK